MNLKKILLSSLILSPTLFLAAACGEKQQIVSKNEVTLSTSQGVFWPLIFGLDEYGKHEKGLIPYYNSKFKNDPDFLPVRIILTDEAKAKTQTETTQNIKNMLDSNSDQLPSLVLGDISTADVLQKYDRLLQFQNTKVKPEIFPEKIVKAYNQFAFGNNHFYNIPFNKNDVDALSFNLDNVKIVLDLVKKGGGKVDESSVVYKKATEGSTAGNSTPENSFFKAVEEKDATVFKDLNVNDETFSNIETALDFARKFMKGLKLKSDAKLDQNTENAAIFEIDYSSLVFIKNLVSKTGKSLWETKSDKLTFPIFDDQSLRDEFKKDYKIFTGENPELKTKVGEKTVVFHAFQFKNFKGKGIGEWASHDILRYRTAFGFVPGVGIKQSIDSATSRSLFASKNPENAKNFATIHDVYTTNQPVKSMKDSPYSVFWSGGSSLIPVKTGDEKAQKATIKFLEWLFNGQNDIDGTMVDNVDYLMENTGYFVPTKAILNQEKLDKIKVKYQNYLDQIKDFETKNKKSFELIGEEAKKIDWKLYERAANLRSVILSMESMLKATKENQDNYKILNDNGDFKATKISGLILDSLIASTQVENKKIQTGEEILRLIDEQK
ncbi:P68 family surface lipoprotein [Mycoplasma sp. 'Moose RK']|uniref:P68 family surface lipoprotein n=1 Tax=Mycoplasma sp. 'Moose RK' TaxID=2780095 RepID=UPI0018C2F2E9|nr:hypothetical protein [Mycoplasma sp. 'Moose RK']MBG0731087.1 hypothetical protein [Mycoplasma sp. 'Moose RK']